MRINLCAGLLVFLLFLGVADHATASQAPCGPENIRVVNNQLMTCINEENAEFSSSSITPPPPSALRVALDGVVRTELTAVRPTAWPVRAVLWNWDSKEHWAEFDRQGNLLRSNFVSSAGSDLREYRREGVPGLAVQKAADGQHCRRLCRARPVGDDDVAMKSIVIRQLIDRMGMHDMTQECAVSLVPIAQDDLFEIEAVFDNLSGYSMNVDGVPRRPDAAFEFVSGVPPGHTIQTKHAFLARHDGAIIGLLDVIDGYPSCGIAFIGLLAVREDVHGKGLGRALFLAAEQLARERLKARTLRLAVVASNPVIGFWEKMGFSPTGEVSPYHGEAISSNAILMEKHL